MTKWLVTVVATSLTLLGLGAIWLSITMPTLYRPALSALLVHRVNVGAVGGFYVIYIAGILALAVSPALTDHSVVSAGLHGAALGAVAYGTYDLTNLATLQGWPTKLAMVDLGWGIFLTAVTSCAGYWAFTLG